MRFAKQVWDFYKNNSLAQDAIETATWTAGTAAGQALFTDMDAGEIAGAGALGAGLAMASRPFGRRLGARLGTAVDNNIPGMMSPIAPFIPVTRDGMAATLKMTRKRANYDKGTINNIKEMLEAKRNQVAVNPDGSPRSEAETMLSYYLGNRADNIAQAGIGIAAPLFLGEDDEQTSVE